MLDKLYNRKDTGMSWTPKGEVPKRMQRAAEGSLEVCFIVPMGHGHDPLQYEEPVNY